MNENQNTRTLCCVQKFDGFPPKSCKTPVRTARGDITFLASTQYGLGFISFQRNLLGKLACLGDILNLFNELNLSLLGRGTSIIINQNKIVAFTKKLKIWKNRINDNVLYWIYFRFLVVKLPTNHFLTKP